MSKQIIITILEAGKTELERTARAVPEDKLNWRPLDNGRPVLDLLGDAAQGPAFCLGILRGEIQYGPETFQKFAEERAQWSRDQALVKLEQNTNLLIRAIEAMTEEQLNAPQTMGERTLPLGSWILFTYRWFVSRFAQINYIQTLYGDFELH